MGGHAEVAAVLLQHPGINVNAASYDGTTSLHLAAQYGHLSVARELLKHTGIDLGLTTTARRHIRWQKDVKATGTWLAPLRRPWRAEAAAADSTEAEDSGTTVSGR